MAYNAETGMYEGYIYKIQSTESSRTYIGQTMQTIEKRWKQHISDCFGSKHVINRLYEDFRNSDFDTFYIDCVEKVECPNKSDLKNKLDILEQEYIEKYDSYHNGNNETKGGSGFCGFGNSVVAYDLYGNYLFETETAIEMAEKTGQTHNVVLNSCNGNSVPKCGYIFRKKGDSFDMYKTEQNGSRASHVYCFDNNGNFLKYYNRVKDAADDLGIEFYNVSQSMRNKRIFNGYYFSDSNVFDPVTKVGNKVMVDMYNIKTKELMKTFESISDACRYLGKEPNMSVSQIKKCLDGKYNQAFGYAWKYHGDSFDSNEHINKVTVMTPVVAYKTNGEYVGIYPSQVIASKELSINTCGINNCLARRQNSTKGYVFYYANDESQPDKTKITNMTANEIIDKYGYVV